MNEESVVATVLNLDMEEAEERRLPRLVKSRFIEALSKHLDEYPDILKPHAKENKV